MSKIKRKYSDEFKLSAVNDCYNSTLGVITIAVKYNIPSKNYINNWESELKRKGLLPKDATKPNKSVIRSKDWVVFKDTRTPKEKQYEEEILVLKAKIDYLESLESLKPFLKKSKNL